MTYGKKTAKKNFNLNSQGPFLMPKKPFLSISDEFEKLTPYENRTPDMDKSKLKDSFSKLFDYRNGGIFIISYSGNSEWERHPGGDEIVQMMDGSSTLILLLEEKELSYSLIEGDIAVVPKNVWHRFENSVKAKVMTVTPQPTDHQIERPID